MKGKDIAVAATVDHVIPEEHGNVNLDKFHDRFINLNKGKRLILAGFFNGSIYQSQNNLSCKLRKLRISQNYRYLNFHLCISIALNKIWAIHTNLLFTL